MFSKNKNKPTTSNDKMLKPAAPSIISHDLKIVGDMLCEGEIQIDGQIEGDIRTKSLLVGVAAKVTGGIVADSVRVHGSVVGQIKARVVNLAKTAHVVGDILHEDLAIETGAYLEGHCRRIPEPIKPEDQRKLGIINSGNKEADKIKQASKA